MLAIFLIMLSLLGASQTGGDRAAKPELAEIAALHQKVVDGSAEAQFQLAEAYEKGAGVDRSDTEAARWYRAAAPANARFQRYLFFHWATLSKRECKSDRTMQPQRSGIKGLQRGMTLGPRWRLPGFMLPEEGSRRASARCSAAAVSQPTTIVQAACIALASLPGWRRDAQRLRVGGPVVSTCRGWRFYGSICGTGRDVLEWRGSGSRQSNGLCLGLEGALDDAGGEKRSGSISRVDDGAGDKEGRIENEETIFKVAAS